MIAIKRVYEPHAPGDGHRVLVDRLWPRGLKREAAQIDAWAKAIAPSTELRKWYGHAPERWAEFRERYAVELSTPAAQAELDRLADVARAGRLTLLTATRAEQGTHATVLRELIEARA